MRTGISELGLQWAPLDGRRYARLLSLPRAPLLSRCLSGVGSTIVDRSHKGSSFASEDTAGVADTSRTGVA